MSAAPEGPPAQLAALQKKFSDHIRDPDNNAPLAGLEARRLAIYRRLFFNNLSNLFGANFPIARKILPQEDWEQLIRAFMAEHRPTTPLFPEIGREFVRFLAEHPEHFQSRWPWLAELCHWQYQATQVRNDENELDALSTNPEQQRLDALVLVNPTLRMAQYHWPVAEIRADQWPEKKQPMILAIWRKRDDRLGRMQFNAVTARLLEIVRERPAHDSQACLIQLADEIKHPDPETLIRHGAQLLADLAIKQVIFESHAT